MTECCIFKNLDGKEKKIDLREFDFVELIGESTRHSHTLYRCKNCGCLVYCFHDEIADFLSPDDCEDYYEELFPVESIDEARRIEAENHFGVHISGRPRLTRTWCSRWDEPEYWKVHKEVA